LQARSSARAASDPPEQSASSRRRSEPQTAGALPARAPRAERRSARARLADALVRGKPLPRSLADSGGRAVKEGSDNLASFHHFIRFLTYIPHPSSKNYLQRIM
jgi:hypothetical protein